MIELHRLEQDQFADEIDDRLKSMVVAYRTVHHSTSRTSAFHNSGGPGTELQESGNRKSGKEQSFEFPHIRESGKVISGNENILVWLEELDRELRQQRSVSGDGCYIDAVSGKIC